MAYDEGLVHRIRDELQDLPELVEKKMFGGVGSRPPPVGL